MTYNEYLSIVKGEYLKSVKRTPTWGHMIGLCVANVKAERACVGAGSDPDSVGAHYSRLHDAIDEALDSYGWLSTLWAHRGQYGIEWRPRDTMRKYNQRLMAARLQFLHNLRD